VLGVVRRTNKAAWNKQAIRTAGAAGNSTGIVEHVGRTSGNTYSTPVDVIPTDDGFVIVLPYGTQADWVRNVMAHGSATIVHDGARVEVHQPQLRHPDDVGQWFTPSARRTNRLFGIRQCLVVHRRDPAPAPTG
jgi:deazaflavin-dependent oxidoreductase (nitroreductase family)